MALELTGWAALYGDGGYPGNNDVPKGICTMFYGGSFNETKLTNADLRIGHAGAPIAERSDHSLWLKPTDRGLFVAAVIEDPESCRRINRGPINGLSLYWQTGRRNVGSTFETIYRVDEVFHVAVMVGDQQPAFARTGEGVEIREIARKPNRNRPRASKSPRKRSDTKRLISTTLPGAVQDKPPKRKRATNPAMDLFKRSGLTIADIAPGTFSPLG